VQKLKTVRNAPAQRRQSGFTLIETMVSLVILLAATGFVMSGMVQLMRTQGTIVNRTEMHSSVRSATELMQQEIGQAGMVSLPADPVTGLTIPVFMVTPVIIVVPDVPVTQPVVLSSLAGIFNGENLVVDTGDSQETITVVCGNPCTNPITATFNYAHPAVLGTPVPVTVKGAFATGIVAPTDPNGSTGTLLKLYGDINGDGNMVYVEYTCDPGGLLGFGPALLRNETLFDAALQNPLDPSKVLLSNLQPNPNDLAGNAVPCFTYEAHSVPPYTFVTDVAVTLTEQTQNPDPQTNQFQTETKALLNVSPRNVFNAWELANDKLTNRVQPMPPTITSLIGQ